MREFTQSWRSNGLNVTLPLHWRKSRSVRLASDLFDSSDEWLDKMFAVMALAHWHTYQVLTKRSERMHKYINDPATPSRINAAMDAIAGGFCDNDAVLEDYGWPLPNVWLGVSAERQQEWDERKEHLKNTPAAVHFASFEPLIGPIVEPQPMSDFIQWAIVGGESGPKARPMHPEWARSLQKQCEVAGVAYFFKQWGEWTPGENVDLRRGVIQVAEWFDERWTFGSENMADEDGHIDDEPDLYRVGKKRAGRLLDGREWNQMPEARP